HRLRPQGPAPGGPRMAGRAPTPQGTAPRDPPAVGGPAAGPGPAAQAQGGSALIAGRALVQTVRHILPELNAWLDRLPDRRDPHALPSAPRSLAWWGLSLFLLPLGRRRQLDFELRDGGAPVRAHRNRLAQTAPTTLPVHDPLDYFLGRVALAGGEGLRTRV